MQKTIEISPVVPARKEVKVKIVGRYAAKSTAGAKSVVKIVEQHAVKTTVGATVGTKPEVRKGGIRKAGPVSLSPNQESMRVSVVDSFKGILEMNDKALNIVAKRM